MLSNPCQAYEAPTSRLINEMPTHCLDNQKAVIIDGIDQHASQNWIKKLKSFYKSKRHSTKQNFSINDTSTIMNYKQDESDTDSSFLIKSTPLTPLSAIDADAIYQDASLARSSSNLHVRHSPYDSSNKADPTMYSNGNQLSAPIDTVIGKPETATVEQETADLPGDLVQGTRHQDSQCPHDHRQGQPPQDDKKEIDPFSLVMQYTLYSQHLRDSADKLSLTSSTSSSSSTSSGHTQCSRIKYEKTRDAESSSHSTIHSLYSTFATSSNDIHTIPYMQPVPCASLSPEWSTLNYYSSSLLRESPPELHKENNTKNTNQPKPTVQFVETLANDIWLGKQTVCEHEKVATWLGTNDPFRASVLKAYMAHFDFENRPLDEAFRILCGKLYFKAESQQMDRIIETFAKRYWECNPMELYHSADVVYAISYSLLLLNTDLHGVHEHHHKMKRTRFVRNTMDTITTLVLPTETATHPSPSTSPLSFSGGFRLRKSKSHHSLATSYRSTLKPSPLRCGKQLLSFQQQQPNNTFASPNDSDDDPMNNEECKGTNGQPTNGVGCKTSTKATTKSQSLADLSFYLRRQHSVTDGLNQTMDQKQWMANMELLLKDMYSSIKSKEILRLSSSTNISTPLHDRKQFSFYKLATEARNKRAIRRKRGQSAPPSSNTVSLCLDQKTQDKEDNELDDPSTPSQYLQQQKNGKDISNHITNTKVSAITDHSSMEGWVMRKCLMQGTRQKAKQRNWIRCYLKIQDGRLIMQYRDRKVLSGQHLLNTIKHHGDDVLTNQVTLDKQDSFALNHSLSRVLPPPGWHNQRTHVVCLQMTDGASWLFQVPSHQKAQDWMRALNYQAALHSKEPLSGAITNIDYGWKNNNNLPLSLPTWELPISCMISNQLSKVDQLHSIDGYIGRLVCCVEHHRNLRGLVEKRFSPRTANRMKAMANWELKMQYLLFEKIKFQTYYDTLACSMVD